jgi:hypothetical protein
VPSLDIAAGAVVCATTASNYSACYCACCAMCVEDRESGAFTLYRCAFHTIPCFSSPLLAAVCFCQDLATHHFRTVHCTAAVSSTAVAVCSESAYVCMCCTVTFLAGILVVYNLLLTLGTAFVSRVHLIQYAVCGHKRVLDDHNIGSLQDMLQTVSAAGARCIRVHCCLVQR